jgi:tetratricopeptide (TPR) repeat protein
MLVAILSSAGGCEQEAPSTASATIREAPGAARPLPMPAPLPPPLVEVLRLNGLGRFEEARALARRYTEANPADGRGPLMIAMTYHQAGNHQPAVPHFERALELSPDYYLTRRCFGVCLFMLGDLAGARHQYQVLLAADPEEPEAHYGIGTVDLEEGHLAEAEARFRRAIELYGVMRQADPRRFLARRSDLARAHARLADVHFARGEYEAARDALLASTTIEPGHISAFYALSLVYRRLGEDALADQALQRYESVKATMLESVGSGGEG